MSRQTRLFLVCTLIFLCALAYAYFWYPREQVFTGTLPDQADVAGGAVTTSQAKDLLAGLRLDFGDALETNYSQPKRDIFAPLYAVPKPRPKPRPKPKPVEKPKPKPVEKSEVMVAPTLPVAPLARFDLLGYLDKGGERTVFLAQNQQIYLVKEGDNFAGEYQVTEVTDAYMMISRDSDSRGIRIEFTKPEN